MNQNLALLNLIATPADPHPHTHKPQHTSKSVPHASSYSLASFKKSIQDLYSASASAASHSDAKSIESAFNSNSNSNNSNNNNNSDSFENMRIFDYNFVYPSEVVTNSGGSNGKKKSNKSGNTSTGRVNKEYRHTRNSEILNSFSTNSNATDAATASRLSINARERRRMHDRMLFV